MTNNAIMRKKVKTSQSCKGEFFIPSTVWVVDSVLFLSIFCASE